MTTPEQFTLEVWVKYAISVFCMLTRFAVRLYIPGWRNLDGTDVWCALAVIFYTIEIVCDHLISPPHYPTNIGLTPQEAMEVPDDIVPLMETGAKLAHVTWTFYICMIWSLKASMLTLLSRISSDIYGQKRVLTYAVIFTIVTFLASLLAHLCPCFPTSNIWRVKPLPGPWCTTRPQNYYVTGVLNMLTDAVIIALPMPLLWNLCISRRRKIALAALFSSGIFIIVCTILRTYYVLGLGNTTDQTLGQLWATRETFVAMVVVSGPGVWPLFTRINWCPGSSTRSTSFRSGSNGPASSSAGGWRWTFNSKSRTAGRTGTDTVLGDGDIEMGFPSSRADGGTGAGDSKERIIPEPRSPGPSAPNTATRATFFPDQDIEQRDMPIMVTTEYTIHVEPAAPDRGASSSETSAGASAEASAGASKASPWHRDF